MDFHIFNNKIDNDLATDKASLIILYREKYSATIDTFVYTLPDRESIFNKGLIWVTATSDRYRSLPTNYAKVNNYIWKQNYKSLLINCLEFKDIIRSTLNVRVINDEFKSRDRGGKMSSNFNPIFNYINVNFILFRVKTQKQSQNDDSAYEIRETYKMATNRKYYFEHDI